MFFIVFKENRHDIHQFNGGYYRRDDPADEGVLDTRQKKKVTAPSNTLLSRHLVIYAVDPDRVKKLLLASVVVSSRVL